LKRVASLIQVLHPVHQDSAVNDVVMGGITRADVEVNFGILIPQHVGSRYEDDGKCDCADCDANGYKLVIQSNQVLPLKNVEVLCCLPQGDFSQIE